MSIRQYLSLARWRQQLSLKILLQQLLGAFGVLWLLTEITSFFSETAGIWISQYWWLFMILGIGYALYSNKPKTAFPHRVSGRDTVLEIVVVDALDIPAALVVPCNTTFDTDLGGLVERSPSIQGRVLSELYQGNVKLLDLDIDQQLDAEGYLFEEVRIEKPGKKRKYEIGTVIQILLNDRLLYFLAHTHINESGRATGTVEELKISLARLWYYIAEKGDKGDIVVPVLGTGHARIRLPREEVIRNIIDSFIASCSEKNYCDKLTIAIYPQDVDRYNIDLMELDSYLEYSCRYAEFDTERDVGEGKPVV